MKKRLVIYHAKCRDGFTAAWVAWGVFGDEDTEYLAASYGDTPPDVAGRDEVLILDFSYPRAALVAMSERTNVIVLDHHKTAKADLADLAFATFDMERSGAGLTWDYLYEGRTPRSWLVNYVEDRDIWRFLLPRSKEVNAWIGACPADTFAQWSELEAIGVGQAAEKGAAVLTFIDRMVREVAGESRSVGFEGHVIPLVNAPYVCISEICNLLAETAPFAMGWHQRRDGLYAYSLRSIGGPGVGIDVSAIAKKYGGGGHYNAAGFTREERLPL